MTPLSHHLGANKSIVIGVGVLMAMLLAGLFYPTPFSPYASDPYSRSLPPDAIHWFGTDINGFDIFSRVIAASIRDLPLAMVGAVASLLIGVPLGLLASVRGRLASVLMRSVDAFQSFPLLILAIVVVTLLGNNLWNIAAAIAVINVPRFMRLVRSEALSVRESRFIEAATAIGASQGRVLFVHLLPNVSGVIFAQFSLAAADALVVITTMNFFGIGVSPPEPTWGSMVQEGASVIAQGQWWGVVFPSVAILIAVLSLNMAADGMQKATDRKVSR
jgi:peptide/nickel transport system permease protein